jgi:hypothetical protein
VNEERSDNDMHDTGSQEALDPSSPQWRRLAMRRLRLERGWTVREVAEKVGLNASQISRAETGLRRPMTVPVMCGVFGVDEAEVLAPCPNCTYQPPPGYRCLRCGTEVILAIEEEPCS